MSDVNELLESAREKRERFSKFLKEMYPNDLIGDDELLGVFSTWSVMDKELETTKKLLDESLEIIKFYGDPETYIKRYTLGWEPINPENDNEQILGYQHPGTDWRGTINPGGKKAREFLAKLKTTNNGN